MAREDYQSGSDHAVAEPGETLETECCDFHHLQNFPLDKRGGFCYTMIKDRGVSSHGNCRIRHSPVRSGETPYAGA